MTGVRTGLLVGMILASVTLAACNNVIRELEHFRDLVNPPVNITEYNYAAADELIAQAKPDLRLSTPIVVTTLHPVNLKPREVTPPFGRVAMDQLATRLVALGYTVTNLGVPQSEALSMSHDACVNRTLEAGGDVMATGTYAISEYDLLINMRLVNIKESRLLASTDYRVPLGSDTYPLIGRDPFYSVPARPNNNPDARQPGSPIPSQDLPTRIVP